jgi:hypothetical protein
MKRREMGCTRSCVRGSLEQRETLGRAVDRGRAAKARKLARGRIDAIVRNYDYVWEVGTVNGGI